MDMEHGTMTKETKKFKGRKNASEDRAFVVIREMAGIPRIGIQKPILNFSILFEMEPKSEFVL